MILVNLSAKRIHMTHTILVIDDEVSMIHILGIIFGKRGYNVISATDPQLVESMVLECAPDLIILDYMMPRINGVQLCMSLRALPVTQTTPIFMLSALNDLGIITECRKAGADDYFTKDEMNGRLVEQVDLRLRAAFNGA